MLLSEHGLTLLLLNVHVILSDDYYYNSSTVDKMKEKSTKRAYRAVAVGAVQLCLEIFYLFAFLLQIRLHVGLPLHGALELSLQHILLVSQLCVHLHEAVQLLLELDDYMYMKSNN